MKANKLFDTIRNINEHKATALSNIARIHTRADTMILMLDAGIDVYDIEINRLIRAY